MGYRLAAYNGDTLPVPQLVLTHLAQTDGDTVRVALYLLQTQDTDPKNIARALGLPSVEAARRALQYWAGAGLLESERTGSALPAPAAEISKIDLSDMSDPNIAFLCTEAQTALGKALSRSEMQRLVALYLTDGWKPDVIMLCCVEAARLGKRSVAAVARELTRWREENVETGEDAEKYLRRRKQRESWCAEVAAQFNIDVSVLNNWEKKAIIRWREEWNLGSDMIDEALLRAGNKTTIRYVNGILKAWRAQGITTVAAARGQGQLAGSNILATERPAVQQPTTAAQKDLFNRNWADVFDEES